MPAAKRKPLTLNLTLREQAWILTALQLREEACQENSEKAEAAEWRQLGKTVAGATSTGAV